MRNMNAHAFVWLLYVLQEYDTVSVDPYVRMTMEVERNSCDCQCWSDLGFAVGNFRPTFIGLLPTNVNWQHTLS
jgi:hypothetical protein